MARVVGIFKNNSTVGAVVEQLRFNDITDITVIEPGHDPDDVAQQMDKLSVPPEQAAEYHTKRQRDGRWLLVVQAEALMLPTVQRALRAGQALDVDLLPEPGT